MEQESKLYISASIADRLPSMVKNELAKLPAQKQEEFVEEYKRKAKSVGIAYLFLIVILAMHYGYLRKWGLQIVFWLTGGGFFIWWLIDLFRLPGLVKNYNKDIAIDTMRNLKAMSS
ncbi:TM2 domain-containing protein [Raineya orbicola]|uniref:TM2 domain n=1 Tax=Raineya orbicola TaxID=2016530 RepID=A0A2N3I094_9BACT|nr:TM2 domain-containing protein [Raineya orbicola]PKQ63740.1 TM2 domain [Raineya orbicola]